VSPALHVRNLGGLLAAEPDWGWRADRELLCAAGRVLATGDDVGPALAALRRDGEPVTVLDAAGLTAVPGLIDGHVHPIAGSASVVPPGHGWTDTYLNAGVTAMVSAGELTFPGVSARDLTPETATRLAAHSAWAFGNLTTPPRVYAGTLLAVPGLDRDHFRQVAEAGGRCVKYIYYPFAGRPWQDEVAAYTGWAAEFGLVTKMHAGGTSYQGHSQEADADLVRAVAPQVLAHANGGPIPMDDKALATIVEHTDCHLELILGGSLRLLRDLVGLLRERGELHRITVGTDTPGGNGTMPRGPLQVVAAIAGLGGVDAATAWRCGTQNVATAHGIPAGALAEGQPGDLLLVGPVRGSSHPTVATALEAGEIVGVGAVVHGGTIAALPGRYTPPPAALPTLEVS
jgi:imidazolonepropionase-like amidohydrolase